MYRIKRVAVPKVLTPPVWTMSCTFHVKGRIGVEKPVFGVGRLPIRLKLSSKKLELDIAYLSEQELDVIIADILSYKS